MLVEDTLTNIIPDLLVINTMQPVDEISLSLPPSPTPPLTDDEAHASCPGSPSPNRHFNWTSLSHDHFAEKFSLPPSSQSAEHQIEQSTTTSTTGTLICSSSTNLRREAVYSVYALDKLPPPAPSSPKSKTCFDVQVTDPQKIDMDTMHAFVQYRIRTKIMESKGKKTCRVVYRRYKDFLWLTDRLAEVYPGVIIPPLPEKIAMGRFNDEFVEQRRGDLQLFLKRILSHPLLCYDSNVKIFLECEDFQDLISDYKKRQGLTQYWLRPIEDFVWSFTGPSFIESDDWLEQQQGRMDELENQLKCVEKSLELIKLNRKGMVESMEELEQNFLSIEEAALMEDDMLALECKTFAVVLQNIRATEEKLINYDFSLLSCNIKEYIRTFGAIKGAYATRVKSYQDWRLAERETQGRRASLETSKTTSSEKMHSILAGLRESQQNLLLKRNEYEKSTIRLKCELERWDESRCAEFKGLLEEYVQRVLIAQQELVNQWKGYLSLSGGEGYASNEEEEDESDLDFDAEDEEAEEQAEAEEQSTSA